MPRTRSSASARWREICPDITLRSTFIVGFPGETEQDFELLLDWLREAQLDRVGCFKYSPVDGAAANALPDPVPDEVKQERWERFMAVVAAISAQKLAAKVGQRMQVLVDTVDEHGGHRALDRGRARDRRRRCASRSPGKLKPGDWADVQVTAADAYDLAAKVVAA